MLPTKILNLEEYKFFYQILIDLCSVSSQTRVRVNFKVRLRPLTISLTLLLIFRPSYYEKDADGNDMDYGYLPVSGDYDGDDDSYDVKYYRFQIDKERDNYSQ